MGQQDTLIQPLSAASIRIVSITPNGIGSQPKLRTSATSPTCRTGEAGLAPGPHRQSDGRQLVAVPQGVWGALIASPRRKGALRLHRRLIRVQVRAWPWLTTTEPLAMLTLD